MNAETSCDGVCCSEEGWLFLSFVDQALVPTHLDSQSVGADEVMPPSVSCDPGGHAGVPR
jgi:hypothetical protein